MAKVYSVLEIDKRKVTSRVIQTFLNFEKAQRFLSDLEEDSDWGFVLSESEFDDQSSVVEYNYGFNVTIFGRGETQELAFENAKARLASGQATIEQSNVNDVLRELEPGSYEPVKKSF